MRLLLEAGADTRGEGQAATRLSSLGGELHEAREAARGRGGQEAKRLSLSRQHAAHHCGGERPRDRRLLLEAGANKEAKGNNLLINAKTALDPREKGGRSSPAREPPPTAGLANLSLSSAGSSSSDAEKQANLALLETDASRPATMDAVKSAVFTQPPALTAEERKQRILDSAEGRSAPPEVPSTSVASSSPLPVVMATAVAEAAAGMATMDISDAPPALTAEERKQRILDQLHPLPQS